MSIIRTVNCYYDYDGCYYDCDDDDDDDCYVLSSLTSSLMIMIIMMVVMERLVLPDIIPSPKLYDGANDDGYCLLTGLMSFLPHHHQYQHHHHHHCFLRRHQYHHYHQYRHPPGQ